MFCVDQINHEHLAVPSNLKSCQFAPRIVIFNLCICCRFEDSQIISLKVWFSRGTRTICEGCECRKMASPTVVFYAAKDRQTIAGVRKRHQFLAGVVFSSAGILKNVDISCERFPHLGSCFTRDLFSNMS